MGVLFGLEPWNFPYYQVARFAAPNLMAGNVVMVKHASNVPQCALAFEQLMHDAGLPAGGYTNLFVSKDQVAALIDDERVRGVALTGSEAAGAVVAARAGRNLKKSTMDLGGSDAFIVLEDADMARAVKQAVSGRMGNAGQAAPRPSVSSRWTPWPMPFLTSSRRRWRSSSRVIRWTSAAPWRRSARPTRWTSSSSRCKPRCTTVPSWFLGGQRVAGMQGNFMQPTILTDVAEDNPMFSEEFFGPVALFFRVPDEAAAVALANNSPFGLGGSVFTQDAERGRRVARRIDTGMVFVNSAAVSMPDLPFGGVKNSGYGRELSAAGIHEFVNKKLIRVA